MRIYLEQLSAAAELPPASVETRPHPAVDSTGSQMRDR